MPLSALLVLALEVSGVRARKRHARRLTASGLATSCHMDMSFLSCCEATALLLCCLLHASWTSRYVCTAVVVLKCD